MKSINDKFILSNNTTIPVLGYGTWQTPDGNVARDSIIEAVRLGYRHIDTAAAYYNEQSVGEAIAGCGVKREELFITSKLWNTDRGYDSALRAFDKTLNDLGLDYLDLYLIHWPAIGEGGSQINADTWRAFEKVYKEGRVKAIGLSNFLPHHMKTLMETAEIAPMVDQVEFHPGQMQRDVMDYCRENNMIMEAWSPLGFGNMLSNELLQSIAKKYNKSVAQLCLRWCLQNSVLPLSKSVTPSRIEENMNIFDFEISCDDMNTINDMPYCGGSGLNPDEIDF